MLKKTDNRGFTFIELILYMAILGIFMVAVVTLITSTVTSQKKSNSRKKLQDQAVETYNTISDMLMGATDVRIRGEAYVGTEVSGTTQYIQRDANFVVMLDNDTKTNPGDVIKKNSTLANRAQNGSGDGVTACYDISDIKPFTDSATPSSDAQVFIDTKYVMIKYASGIVEDSLTGLKDSVYTYCTLKYDEAARCIYINRTTTPTENYVDSTDILCKNVENFQMQVNPETGTFAVIMEFKDPKTGIEYSYNGVVSLRNSFVLKKHEW
ncbi:MAG: type II secretion system protein [Coprococcus sp.]